MLLHVSSGHQEVSLFNLLTSLYRQDGPSCRPPKIAKVKAKHNYEHITQNANQDSQENKNIKYRPKRLRFCCDPVLGSYLKPVDILNLAVKWHCCLDYASPWRIDDESRLRITGRDFIQNFTKCTTVSIPCLYLQ